jgi:hypothetical protein
LPSAFNISNQCSVSLLHTSLSRQRAAARVAVSHVALTTIEHQIA